MELPKQILPIQEERLKNSTKAQLKTSALWLVKQLK